MKKSIFTCMALAAVGSFCVAGSALAVPITGGFSMTGTFAPVDVNGVATSILDSTGIDFGGWYSGGPDNTFLVTTGSGDFAGLSGATGTINNFQFNPLSAPVSPLWSVGEFSFEMTSLSYGTDETSGSSRIDIYGTGMFSAANYDPTPGMWNFTGQGAQGANFSLSASSATTAPVPEPATMLLFGTGLMSLVGGIRRKFRKEVTQVQHRIA